MVNVLQSALTIISVPWISMSGHKPMEWSNVVRIAMGMIIAVRGRAKRLVRMKYCGNVPKYNHARGPVVS